MKFINEVINNVIKADCKDEFAKQIFADVDKILKDESYLKLAAEILLINSRNFTDYCDLMSNSIDLEAWHLRFKLLVLATKKIYYLER